MDLMAKLLAPRVTSVQSLWARYTVQTIMTIIIVAPNFARLTQTKHLKAQRLRSVFLFSATACFFVGYEVNSLTLTVAIANTAPFLVGMGAALFLGERFGPLRIIATVIGLAGALIIIRPFGEDFSPWALLPFAGAIFYSAYALTTRAIGPDEDVMTSMFYSAILATILLCVAAPFAWEALEPSDVPLLLGVGLFGGTGQLLLIKALGWAEAGFLAPFMYAQLIFAALLQLAVFKEAPDGWTLIGAALIVAAGLFVWWRSQRVPADG